MSINPLTEFVVSYGDIVEMGFPTINTLKYQQMLQDHPGWKQYNTYKDGYNRYGLSVTSLDGGYSGVPDLESLSEYYKETGKMYYDKDFTVRTPLSYEIPEVAELCDFFEDSLCRSHFLKLDKGGFFPPHRDHDWHLPNDVFRIIVPFGNFSKYHMSWIFDDKVIELREGVTYFMNTTKAHSLFSYVDNCMMLVLNVKADQDTMVKMIRKMRVF